MTLPAPDFDFPDEPNDYYNLITGLQLQDCTQPYKVTRFTSPEGWIQLTFADASTTDGIFRRAAVPEKTAWHARRLWLEACLRIDEGSKRMAKSRVTSDTRS